MGTAMWLVAPSECPVLGVTQCPVTSTFPAEPVKICTGNDTSSLVWWTSVLRPRVLWRPPQSSWRDCPAMTGFFKGAPLTLPFSRRTDILPTFGGPREAPGAKVLALVPGTQEMPSPVGLLRALPLPWPQFLACTLRRLAGPRESTGPSQKPPPLCSVPCRVPAMTEEVAREALLSFVDSKCCYSSTVAGDLVIQELKRQTLCRYRLETFSESRISEWTFQPFTNHSVDGPQRGASPRLWDIKVQGPPMFQEDTRKFQVPHSSLVKECHKCHGRGRYKCSGCHGAGTVRCPSCCGAKRKAKQSRRCQLCAGSGRRRCSTCSGRGNKTCATCKGEKKLLHFIQLVIMWKNSLFEFVSEHRLNCPRELLAKAKGENLFKDENSVVYPIVDFPLRDISLASQRGIAEHSAALASRARVLQQRQTIELIPLTEVHYWYQGKTYVYYIYGTDHQVYAVDYPERYCCGCTIV
ncbi:protein SSUH2 homolog isoform X11 [Homo sapiens]|uniref:protein SSUH2 homolog isoform X11 n=1 Tax=Homo sapiens TaxID=9606 RepID=UPI0007DC8041|nr:protein SSUH2 homolog isoform X11 [Homo sapiens]|eukprot:XP_016862023.1 protein SSUH2 homolog isoform X13 [Homo sapiens]